MNCLYQEQKLIASSSSDLSFSPMYRQMSNHYHPTFDPSSSTILRPVKKPNQKLSEVKYKQHNLTISSLTTVNDSQSRNANIHPACAYSEIYRYITKTTLTVPSNFNLKDERPNFNSKQKCHKFKIIR